MTMKLNVINCLKVEKQTQLILLLMIQCSLLNHVQHTSTSGVFLLVPNLNSPRKLSDAIRGERLGLPNSDPDPDEWYESDPDPYSLNHK